jgi:hypothetical protein
MVPTAVARAVLGQTAMDSSQISTPEGTRRVAPIHVSPHAVWNARMRICGVTDRSAGYCPHRWYSVHEFQVV